MIYWSSFDFSMIQQMSAICSLVPPSFLNPAYTSGSSQSTYYWSIHNLRVPLLDLRATWIHLKIWIFLVHLSWTLVMFSTRLSPHWGKMATSCSRLTSTLSVTPEEAASFFSIVSCPGYYKQCCHEHWGTCVSFNSVFLSVYAQKWDCWVIWQFYFQFFKESPHCSP